ncbi:lipoprotein 17-related variable surface protein [Mycoplasma sp. 21DD0573]|uniref:lipoprotein 17-related variable surface protein n=1 Tax=Mycoplasma sp. 21DD0573 TaxID=3108525 RepID=UPI002B1CE3C3|nr:lipoprotein 17-related variable surface protein [Mycoplasma sp. 21DD0573]MEA4276148.1 lipoprotein 17-related variable surface protein [Mycoplasma sp. 21DD0573]
MKKSRKIFLSFGGIIASSLFLVSAITAANQENWNEFQRTTAEDLKTFIESQKKLADSTATISNLHVPNGYKSSRADKKKIIDFAIDENQLQSVYDFFIQLPSFNQINDENSKNEWIKEIKNWFWCRPYLYFDNYNENKKGSLEWRFMPNEAITDEDHAAENAIEVFDQKIKDLTTFKTLSEYRGRFNTFQEFEKFILDELQAELKKEVYNAPRAYCDNFVTILKNATVDPNDSNNLNRNIPQDLSNTLLNWLKNSQNLNADEKAKGGNHGEALELLGDNGLIGINNKIAEIRTKLATYQAKKASFDYKFEPDEPEKTDFDNEKEKLTTQLQELQKKLNELNTAINGTISSTGWDRKKRKILNLTTTNDELATGLNTYIVAEDKLEGLLKYREKVAELQKILSDSSLSDEQKKHYTERINSLGEDADNYAELQTIGDEIKNSIEAESNVEEIINKFSLWTDEQQKEPYREQIKNVYKDSNLDEQAKSAKIKQIEQQIFSKMKENANNLIDQTSLENTEKNAYKTLISSENMDKNINPYDFPLLKTITKAKIDNLDSLNPAQKEYFKNKINDPNINDLTKLNAILTEAETVNQKMNNYKNTFKDDANSDATNVATIKKSTDYTEADSDKKTAFDNALDQRNTDLTSSTDNLTTEQINQKITALKQAKEDLNGDENLAEAKKQAKNKLDTAYTYLNNAQKEDAINKIEALTTVNAVNNQDAENKKLDDAMKSYSQSLANIESIRKTTDYTQADNQNTLENLITAKENDINKTSGANLTLEQVNGKITALNDAVTALNGDERLKAAKDEAIRKINSEYSYLTQKQKEKAIELINSQNTIEDVNNQDTTNKALDSSMKTLKDYIFNHAKVTSSNDYIYTTNALRAAYDGNPTKNNNVKSGAIKKAEDLVTALNTDNNSDLMNKETIDALNEKIKAAINALNGQERYEAEVARLNQLSTATAKVKDNIKTTDTASEISNEEIEFNNDTIPQDAKPVDLNITNRNEVTGKLELSYKYQSTKENLESVQSSKTYTLNDDNALSTLTEQERLDQLVQDEAVTKTVDFNDTDLKSFAVSDLNKDNFTTSITPNNNAKVIIDKIEPDPDDPRGVIVTYKLESTKDNLDNQKVVSSKSLTTKITGFMTSEEKEQKTINSYNGSNFLGTPDSLIQASEFVNKLSEVNIAFDRHDNVDHSNETIVVKSIKSWDDRTGTLVANFVVQSNKNGKVLTSDLKTITINGYMTEEERLNDLLINRSKKFEFNGDKPQNKTTVDEVELAQLSGYLAGSNNKVKLIIDEITARDNQNGALTFKYHLLSTRTDIPNNNIVSQSRTYSLSPFQTDSEREKENKREKENLNAKGIDDLEINVTKNKLASDYNVDEITLSAKDSNVSVIDKKIIGYNDITGEIKLSYKLKSNQSNIESDTKEIILSDFKTESQRLNELLNTLSKEDISFDGTKKDQLPSVEPANNKNNYTYDETKKTTNKANIEINSITPNNQAGENTLNLKLISTKTQNELVSNWKIDNFVAPESNNKNSVIDGFRTKEEQDRIDRETEKERLNNLTVVLDYENKTTTLPSSTVIEKVIKTIKEATPEARVVIDNIDARNEIEGSIRIQYHLVSEKSDEIYQNVTSDNKYAQINGFKTEQMRLDEIMQKLAIEAGIKNIASDQYNKWTASLLLNDLILNKLETNQDTSYNLKVVDKSANDNAGEISYTWQIISNRGVVNSQNLNTVTSSDEYNKSGTLSGFKTLEQIEKERLNSLDFSDKVENGVVYRIDYPNKENKQASSLTDATTNWTWDTFNRDNYEFINQKIVGYNDLTGEIRLSFQIKSTKPDFSSVVSDTKEIIISGFETELQRLNKLVDTNPYNISLNNTVNKPNKKASTLSKDDFSASIKENADNTNDYSSDLLLTDANDNTGEIGVKYKLISNRQVNTDQTDLKKLVSNWKEKFNEQKVISKESTSVNFAGFLTNIEEEKRRIEDFLSQIALDFANRNQYLPIYNKKDVIDSKVIVKLNNNETLEQNHIKVKENSLTITERDDREGYIKVTYTLQSTKPGLEGAEIVVNETRSANTNKLSGFKTELQRLEGLVFDFNNSVSDKNQKQASDTAITISNLSQNDAKTTNITISNKTRNDRNGTLSGTYSIYSTRDGLNDIHVDDKEFTINGFLTEQQRVNNLLADDTVQAHVEYKLDNQAKILPSELLANKDEVLNNLSTYFDMNLDNEVINQANLKIIELSADDTNGSITFKYKIASTKENFTDIESENFKTITLSGFLNELDKYKEKAKKTIDALQNISETQKDAAKAKVEEQNTINNVNNIVSNTTAVDAALGSIKDIVPVKEKVQFKEADVDKQNALTTALDNLASLESKEDFENAVENLQDKVQTLKDAHKALNGDSNLAKAKEEAIAAIDKLSYLSETQKDAAKADINAKEAIVDVNNIVNNATLMNNAKEALDKASKAQKTIAYTEASEQPKTNFDAAKANVEAIKDITNFNEPVDKIVDLTNKLNNATAALDGSASLDAAKEETLKELDKLSYLSDQPYSTSEKFKASEAIKNATDAESLAKAIEDAKALNKANYNAKVSELDNLTNEYLQSTYGTAKSNKLRAKIEEVLANFAAKSFEDTNGAEAIAKSENLLSLVDYITTDVSKPKFNTSSEASSLSNIDQFSKALNDNNYFNIATKDKSQIKADDVKNLKQIISNIAKINNLNVLTTAITKSLKETSPILIWPYFVAASAATWLIGMLIFVFGRKK